MFGHEKGSFTGAINRHLGKFALAENGTIFLDEIGELSAAMQAKLLRVIQEKEYTPIGATQTHHTNARIIAATNVNLAQRVAENRFREDLYYRLCVVNIHLPPLRKRPEDIHEMVEVLLARINRQMNRSVNQVSTDVMNCLEQYAWPGNVRELENVLAKAVALCPGHIISKDLVEDVCGKNASNDTHANPLLSDMSLNDMEKVHVTRVLEAQHWHRGKACEILGVSRPRLRRMIKHFGLIPPEGIGEDDDDAADENEQP
jgi:transcriptional regulator with PAS, ATPase and Fis domain